MKLNEFFDHLDEVKKFAPGVYTHQVKALTVMPTQDKTLWADAGELPKKFNVTQMNIGIYDEQDDNDPYSYGNTGLEVFHDAGTWQMYTDDTTEQQISDYLGVKVSFSEQGMQNEKFMHFDISDEAVAQLISKGAFKLEETATEDDMSTGTVAVGKKGKTRRATGIGDNPYDHNEGEDQTALVNSALWNMKDVYQTIMSGEALEEDDMFSYGDLVQYLEQADMPDHYSKFWDLVVDAINSAGGFKGQGDEIMVDKNIAPQIKTLYQQFKAATAKVKGVKEDDVDAVYPGTGDIYGYTWNCKKCGTENEFSMSRQDAQEYIDDWEADNEDLVADGETGSAALIDTLAQGEDSGFHYGNKCVKCGTEAKNPYQESINDIIKLSGLK